MDNSQLKPFDFTQILERCLNPVGSTILVNLSVMGSQPMIVSFTDYESLISFCENNPNVTVLTQSIPLYGKNS